MATRQSCHIAPVVTRTDKQLAKTTNKLFFLLLEKLCAKRFGKRNNFYLRVVCFRRSTLIPVLSVRLIIKIVAAAAL